MKVLPQLLSVILFCGGCQSSTGGNFVTFKAFASGPKDATGAPLTFNNNMGYRVTLTQASLHMGALYLNQQFPIAGAQQTDCILQGVYVGEVLGDVDVDVLSPIPQSFRSVGVGLKREVKTAELWLTGGGDINALTDPTIIAQITGTATKNGTAYPFAGQVTIGHNRQLPPLNPAEPGSNPICKQRIISGLAVQIDLVNNGNLLVQIDPRVWMHNIEFANLPNVNTVESPRYEFLDSLADPISTTFFDNLKNHDAYSFEWSP